jgi:NAD(P) transhydrogenase
VVENEVGVTQDQLKRNGVDVIHGIGKFMDAHHIHVENGHGFAELLGEFIVIATGTKPAANDKVPINGRNIIDSDQILSMPQIPRTLIVVGGGVIGVEYACMFATLGVRVIIVEKRPRLLEFADTEMVEALRYQMRDPRATMRLNEEVESVEELPDGKVAANLAASRWTPIFAPLSHTSSRWAMSLVFPAWPRFPWSRDASLLRAHSACKCKPIPIAILTGFTPSRRFLSSARPKSS